MTGSYTLDTGKKYIKDIFAADFFYNIPEYQRPYVWGEDQITVLLEDLTNAMEYDKKKEYFLGCMIWNTKKVKEGEIEYICQDILDGQQRFITIYILQGVLRDLSNNKELKEKVNDRLKQKEDVFDGIPARNRIEFEIRYDKEFIDKYLVEEKGTLQVTAIEKFSRHKESSTSIKNMALAILIMKKWWDEKLSKFDTVEESQKYLNDFYSYLSSKVLALYLATPNNLDDAYNLFTVLNSRGLQLQVSDILRAQNLRVLKEDKQRKEYAKKWEIYENSIGAPYKSFDDLLWALVFIKMKYRSDDNQSLTKAFNFMYNKKLLEKGAPTFDFVGRYIRHFKAVTSNNFQTEETGSYFSNLNFILTTTFGSQYIAPLIHYRECFGEYRIVEFLIKIDNLFSASWLVDNRNLQTRIFIMLRRMDEIKKEISEESLAADQFLDEPVLNYNYQDEKAATAIDLDRLFEMFDREKWGSFSGTRVNKTRYVLLKLDLLTSNLNTQLYFNKSVCSIEHLMPQKIAGTEWNILEDDHKQWLHRLGNLVLIDRKKNASLSNLPYSIKKIKYQGAIENRANTNYVFMAFSDWHMKALQENHMRAIQLLKEYYTGNSLLTLKNIKKRKNQLALHFNV